MIIGVDFDNTIVCYDHVFQAIARDRGLIPPNSTFSKRELHDHLHELGQADVWTSLQGEVYGPLMKQAMPFPGVIDFFQRCRTEKVQVRIISHRTRYPYLGEKHDLHAAARNWLAEHRFFDSGGIGLAQKDAFFDESRAEKLARIAEQGCTDFVEDLVEVLAEPLFPKGVRKILFDPNRMHVDFPLAERAESWPAIEAMLLVDRARAGALSPSPGTPGEGRGGGRPGRSPTGPHPNPPPEYQGRGPFFSSTESRMVI